MEKLLLLFACVFAAAYAQGPEPHRCGKCAIITVHVKADTAIF